MLGWTSLGAWGAAPAWAGLQWRGFLSRSRLNLIFLRLVLFRSLPFTLSLSFFSSLFLSLYLRPISLFLSVWQSKSPHIFFLSLSLLTKSDSRKERERHNKPNRREKRRQTDKKKKTDRRREKGTEREITHHHLPRSRPLPFSQAKQLPLPDTCPFCTLFPQRAMNLGRKILLWTEAYMRKLPTDNSIKLFKT